MGCCTPNAFKPVGSSISVDEPDRSSELWGHSNGSSLGSTLLAIRDLPQHFLPKQARPAARMDTPVAAQIRSLMDRWLRTQASRLPAPRTCAKWPAPANDRPARLMS